MFGPDFVAAATYTASGNGATVDTGDGIPPSGIFMEFDVTNVIGNPDVQFYFQTSDDNALWWNAGFDEFGPVQTETVRHLRIQTRRRYYRAAWLFQYNDPGGGSLNSSSLSGTSFESSSSGGSAAITFAYGLVPSYTG